MRYRRKRRKVRHSQRRITSDRHKKGRKDEVLGSVIQKKKVESESDDEKFDNAESIRRASMPSKETIENVD